MPAGLNRDEERDEAGHAERQGPDARRVHDDGLWALRRGDHDRARTQGPHGDHEVARQQREGGQAGARHDESLGAQGLQEHLLVAELLEPEPVGVERRGRRHAGHEDDQDRECREPSESDHRVIVSCRATAYLWRDR